MTSHRSQSHAVSAPFCVKDGHYSSSYQGINGRGNVWHHKHKRYAGHIEQCSLEVYCEACYMHVCTHTDVQCTHICTHAHTSIYTCTHVHTRAHAHTREHSYPNGRTTGKGRLHWQRPRHRDVSPVSSTRRHPHLSRARHPQDGSNPRPKPSPLSSQEECRGTIVT